MDDKKNKEQQHEILDFNCSQCGMSEKVHYKGATPPFSRNIILKYPGYVMKDPFSQPGKGEILFLGADCVMCEKPVCINRDCSVFYMKMYCKECAHSAIDKFPREISSKIGQQRRNIQN